MYVSKKGTICRTIFFVVVAVTSCSRACLYEPAILLSYNFKEFQRVGWAPLEPFKASKKVPPFWLEMISLQILLATDRCLIRHSGVSVGMILTPRLALRGWSIVPWHARLDRSLFLGTCKCSAVHNKYWLRDGHAPFLAVRLESDRRHFSSTCWGRLFTHQIQSHWKGFRKNCCMSSVHVFTFKSVAGAPFCLWELHT